MRFPRWLTVALVGLIGLGMVFRFVNLNHKVYGHDEVDTTLRAAGYTQTEMQQALFQNQIIPAIALQRYQQIKPGSTAADTVRSLAVENPHHPPLYFVLTRWWMQTVGTPLTTLFHSSLTVTRSLPVILSVLALPAMYGLAWELFASHPVSLLATTLIALSPLEVIFAQTARQYSLLTVLVLVSSYVLLRAIRVLQADTFQTSTRKRNVTRHLITWLNWGFYALAIAVGFYTHLLFGLTVISHATYVAACAAWNPTWRKQGGLMMRFCFGAIAIALLLFSPWLGVMLMHGQPFPVTAGETQPALGVMPLPKVWGLSFTALFFDLDFGLNHPLTILARLPFVLLIGISIDRLCRRTPLATWLFVVLTIAIPFLLAIMPTVILGGTRAVVGQALVGCYPGIFLAVAYFLAHQLSTQRVYSGRSRSLTPLRTPHRLHPAVSRVWQTWVWRGILGLMVLGSLTSLTVSALAWSGWEKHHSFANNQTADLLNQKSSLILISDPGDGFTNTADLVSLSYRLKPDTSLLLLQSADYVKTPEFDRTVQEKVAIAFRPSPSLQQALDQKFGQSSQILKAERLWQVPMTQPLNNQKSENFKKKD